MIPELNFNQVDQAISVHSTPLYLYHHKTLVDNFKKFEETLKSLNPTICYAVKACSTLGILKLFHELGGGFDIVSQGELRRVLKVGGETSRTVFAGVGKSVDEMRFALMNEIRHFNVESKSELETLEAVAKSIGKVAKVAFRINPNVDAKTHHHISTGTLTNKFGMTFSDALELYHKFSSSQSLSLSGLHCHIGSQITDLEPIELAYREMMRVASHFEEQGMKIDTIDLGGGFGIQYQADQAPLDLVKLSEMISRVLVPGRYSYLFEPGRFLVASSAVLVTKVLYIKENKLRNFAISDAGMNDLIRPAFYDAYHEIKRHQEEHKSTDQATKVYDIVGPVCESGCYFAKQRELPQLKQGDYLMIGDAGAYGSSMSSNYNSRPRPAEALLMEDGTVKLLRRRESYEELYAQDLP